ncbi:MAG: hypothetical protein ACRDJV_01880 [Actinomycetota bacterium]
MLDYVKKHLSVILVAMVTASLTAAAPVIAHGVRHARFAHNADKLDGLDSRDFAGRTTKMKPGKVLTGTYSTATSASGGFMGANIEFRPRLPADIPPGNVHYMAAGTTSPECAGAGRAARGHLCVYEQWINGASYTAHVDPNSSDASGAVKPNGVGLVWTSSSTAANTRGVWAVKGDSPAPGPPRGPGEGAKGPLGRVAR